MMEFLWGNSTEETGQKSGWEASRPYIMGVAAQPDLPWFLAGLCFVGGGGGRHPM